MAYLQHYRLTMEGTIGAPGVAQEIFAMALSVGQEGIAAPAELGQADVRNAAYTAIEDWFGGAGPRIHPSTRLRRIRFEIIGPDGRLVTDNNGIFIREIHDIVNGVPGGGAGEKHPTQVAWAHTLVTDRSGRSGKGRIYCPTPAGQLDPDFRFDAGFAQTAADEFSTLIGALNGALGPANRVIVASSKGFNTYVKRVRVGRVLDTIRRRRNALDEAYAQSVV